MFAQNKEIFPISAKPQLMIVDLLQVHTLPCLMDLVNSITRITPQTRLNGGSECVLLDASALIHSINFMLRRMYWKYHHAVVWTLGISLLLRIDVLCILQEIKNLCLACMC